MNKTILLYFLAFSLAVQHAHSQTLNCKIDIELVSPSLFKYAYLRNAKAEKFYLAPLKNGHFEFDIQKDKDFQLMTLWLVEDTLVDHTYKMLDKKIRDAFQETKILALENMKIKVFNTAHDATVLAGQYNKDLDSMYEIIKSGNFKEFFIQHPDSPVSLLFLKSLIRIKSAFFQTERNPKLYYQLISDRMKSSAEGLELKKEIYN